MTFASLHPTGLVAAALVGLATMPLHAAEPPAPRQHTTGDHPAVVVARLAKQTTVDTNLFRVQPPAAVTWTLQSAGEPAPVVASASRTAL